MDHEKEGPKTMPQNMTTVEQHSPKENSELEENLNQMYQILMGLLIQLMQCGFAFLEAGVVASKNTTNIMMKNALDACVAAVAYWLTGFALAFGPGNRFIGWRFWATSEYSDDGLSHFFLEMVIAATCSTIVSGSVVGRCKMVGYLIYSFIITGFIYPVVTRWVWNKEGWLNMGQLYEINGRQEPIGFFDFSGSGAVHLCGGTAAFFGALILGPRNGRFDAGIALPPEFRGHSVPYAGFGTLILLIGFMAFNGGSVMTVTNSGDGAAMSLSIVNTMISAGAAGYSSLFFRRFVFRGRKWSVFNTVNGAVCGMVAICASCNIIRPWGALIVGIVAGILYNVVSWSVSRVRIDDPADSVGIHFAGGVWGLLAVALLKYKTGILMAWDRRAFLMLAWQLTGICTIILWSGLLTAVMFSVMKYTGVFRVSAEVEKSGSDMPEHDEAAYQYHLGSLTPDVVEQILALLEERQAAKAAALKNEAGEGKDQSSPQYPEGKSNNKLDAVFVPSRSENECHKRASGHVNLAFYDPSDGITI